VCGCKNPFDESWLSGLSEHRHEAWLREKEAQKRATGGSTQFVAIVGSVCIVFLLGYCKFLDSVPADDDPWGLSVLVGFPLVMIVGVVVGIFIAISMIR